MLAVLITLFLLSWGLVLTVMTFQDITINAQRLLILDLFRDSSQLSAMRMKEAQKNHPAPGDKSATTNKDKGKAQNKAAKPRQRMTTPTPQLPDGPDVSDARRVQISI